MAMNGNAADTDQNCSAGAEGTKNVLFFLGFSILLVSPWINAISAAESVLPQIMATVVRPSVPSPPEEFDRFISTTD